jgi:hypothetical protein
MTRSPLPKPFASLPITGSQTTSINVWTSDAIEAYATAAVLAEREACAKVCEENWQHVTAAAIRARNEN